MDTIQLLALAILFVLALVMLRSGKPETLPGGAIKMQYGKIPRVIGLSTLAGSVGVMLILLKEGYSSTEDLVIALCIIVGLLLMGIILVLTTVRVYFIVDETGIENRTMFGTIRKMHWQSVQTMVYSRSNTWFVLKDDTGMKMRISAILKGMKQFTEYVRSHTPPEVHEAALNGYKPRSLSE